MDPVPTEKEAEVLPEASAVLGSSGSAGQHAQTGHQLVERVSGPPRHLESPTRTEGQAFFAARTGALSDFLFIRSMYFC